MLDAGGNTADFSKYTTLLDDSTDSPVPFAQSEAFYYFMKNNALPVESIENLTTERITQLIHEMTRKHTEFPQTVAGYAAVLDATDNNLSSLTLKTAYWLYNLCVKALTIENNGLEDETTEILYLMTIKSIVAYMKLLYKPELLTDDGVTQLNGVYRFIYYADKAENCSRADDAVGFLNHMKTALQQNCALSEPAHAHIERFRQRERQKENAATVKQTQLDLLTHNLKAAIITLINTGEIAQAETVLAKYEQMLPGDDSIEDLRKRIDEAKQLT